MASFEWGISKWDVDKDAESLNNNLFGAKKMSKRATAPDIKVDCNPSDIHDSDNEQFSKKAKKKMKKKLKKTKLNGGVNINNSDAVKESDNMEAADNIKSDGSKKKKRKKKKKENTSNCSTGNSKEIDKTQQKKSKSQMKENNSTSKGKTKERGEDFGSPTKGGKQKKRKRSDSEDNNPENGVATKKRKTSNNADKQANVENGQEGEPGKKRRLNRRNRKKKNNSKKNKYKHLALNAKNDADKKADTAVESEKISEQKMLVDDQKNVIITPQQKEKNKSKAKVSKTKQSKSMVNSFDKSIVPTITSQEKVNEEGKTDIKSRKRKAEDGGKLKNKLNKKKLIEMLNGSSTDNKEAKSKAGSHEVEIKSSKKKVKKKKKKNSEKGSINVEESTAEMLSKSVPDKMASKGLPLPVSDPAKELKEKATEKLNAARFRFINEQLYTCKGNEALQLFRRDPVAFQVYHQGFKSQTTKWPRNPLDIIIKHVNNRPQQQIVADFGCGDARLSQSVRQKVHSFDLVALNDRITACDMSKTPLSDDSVDIAVFCLSLMGTNLNDYITEANRVLKPGGLLKVAEVASRFDTPERFIKQVSNLGFLLLNKRELSDMFYLMDFKKVKRITKSSVKTELKLKPCVYKKR